MTPVFKEFTQLEQQFSAERGAFTLFALVRPEAQELDKWDVVVSAPWAADNEMVRILAERISATFSDTALRQVARIIPVPADHPLTQALLAEYPVEHGRLRVDDDTFLGLPITKAYIITARPTAPVVVA